MGSIEEASTFTKSKEKQIVKDQSSSHFFKTLISNGKKNKNEKQVSRVEIGVPDPIEEQYLGRPTPCTVLAVVITLFLLVLLIFALGEFGLNDPSAFVWERPPKNPPRQKLEVPCNTKECVRYSAELFQMMNESMDPCENFHEHVCAGFNPKKRQLERLLKLVETSSKPEHLKAVRVVRKLLSKCAVVAKTQLDKQELRRYVIPEHLPFPLLSPDWTSPDPLNSSQPHLHKDLNSILQHIGTYTPDDMGILGVKPSSDSEFSVFIVKPNSPNLSSYQFRNVVNILRNSLDLQDTDCEKQLKDLMEFQTRLGEIEFKTRPELVPLSDVQKAIDIGNVNFTSLIDAWYPGGRGSLKNKTFGFNTTYYEELNRLLCSTSSETLYNFLFLRFAYKFLHFELSAEKEETCLLQVSHTIPGKIVLYGSEEPEAVNRLRQILFKIREQLRKSLSTLKWMDSRAIEEAQKKFFATTATYGFDGENLIDELEFRRDAGYISVLSEVLKWQTRNMFKSVAEDRVTVFLNAEVFYSVPTNHITISRSLLHYPYMSSHLPTYTNYATIASRILPHLTHAFDERGRFYDAKGRHRDWWNSETEKYFRVIVQCFEGMMQNVLGASISIGWNAYDVTTNPYSVLPGMQNSTDNALFFYSLVKTMCTSDSAKVNEALASVPQFNEAFQCELNSTMNPQTKCRLAS